MSESKNVSLENWSNFFKEIAPIFEKRKIILDEKKKRGDFFNVFSILRMETLEVKTHSAFLAELLNPDGNHGLGNKFLIEFIKMIPESENHHFLEKTKTTPEYPIGAISKDYNEGGRLDILIESPQKIIIIENKIIADDEKKQLIRYYNYARKKGKKFAILYLTLDGKEASQISIKGKDIIKNKDTILQPQVHYYPISYKGDILLWLMRCLEISASHPMVRETIIQYINLIKKLTNIMDEETKNLLLSEKNIAFTAEILSSKDDLEKEIRIHFLELLKEKNFLGLSEWIEVSTLKERWLFQPKEWPGIFYFSIDNYGTFGIYNRFLRESADFARFCKNKSITLGKLKFKEEEGNGSFPFGQYVFSTPLMELIKPENNIFPIIESILKDIYVEKLNISIKKEDAGETFIENLCNLLNKTTFNEINLSECFKSNKS